MPRDAVPRLSKSRYMAGLQCHGRLFRKCYQPDLATQPDAATQARLDTGTEVGVIARGLLPGGEFIDEPYTKHSEAAERTRALLDRDDIPAIYEASFIEDDVRIRADILAQSSPGTWDLIEVKSSASIKKDEHIPDAAVQLVVLEHAGLLIDRVSVAHINREYIYPGGDYQPDQLLTVVDITEAARAYSARVPGELQAMREMLAEDEPPDIDVGSHCKKPHDCEFYDYCRAKEPAWSIEELPRLSKSRREQLRGSGVRSIVDIPSDLPLTPMQEKVRRAVISAGPQADPLLESELQRIVAPAHFIDFETMNPGLPIYPGTRPYEVQPFQWSDHVLHPDGSVTHHDFLADGNADRRAEFTETLIAQLEGAATLVVYSSYEQTRLRGLSGTLPDWRDSLEQVLARPWVDLLKIVRDHYYHPDFHGSFSIKSVLPALVPGFTYEDLAIQDGDQASVEYLESINPGTASPRRDQLRTNLLDYCKRDTEAMLRVVDALRAST